MIKRYVCLLCLLLLGKALFADERSYLLTGYMGVQGGESFTYKLALKDSTGNWLCGYSYTYSLEPNNVKSYVVAYIDRQQRNIKLEETQIIHNHLFYSKAIICLVNADLAYQKEEHKLSGSLHTQTAGAYHAACAKGSITFLNKQEIDYLFSEPEASQPEPAIPTPKPAPVPASKPLVKKTAPSIAPVKKPTDQITEGKDKSYSWHSDEVVLDIWDGNQEDNDIVTILYNGENVLNNYRLRKEPQKLVLPIGGNELNIITIEANNEGGNPPNTANIRLQDGAKTYEVVAHNKTGKRAIIRIKKQP